jgi:hypothetical protein
MTAGRPRSWLSWARHAGLAAAACAALGGCRMFDRGGSSGGGGLFARGGDRPDPLLGSRIPATDLPVPGRGEGYGKGTRDPLLGSPTGRGERFSRTDGREPFRLGPENTTAGLAGRLTPGDVGLSIGDRPAGRADGPVPLRPTDRGSAGGMTYSQITDALKKFDARWAEPTQEGGEYLFRADVPIEGGADGAVRRYEGAGSTPAAAARQVLDQIKSDRGL